MDCLPNLQSFVAYATKDCTQLLNSPDKLVSELDPTISNIRQSQGGDPKSAQGIALGTGLICISSTKGAALKGFSVAPLGLDNFFYSKPRAMPWADIGSPRLGLFS